VSDSTPIKTTSFSSVFFIFFLFTFIDLLL
jgi:hypothetical protein